MKQEMHRRYSIYIQLLRLLIASAFAAILAFLVLYGIGSTVVDSHLENPSYVEKLDQKYIDQLQQYVTDNQVRSGDSEALLSWVETHKVIYICVYKDDKKVFDSDYPGQELAEEEIEAEYYEWENYYPVEFADGAATVNIQSVLGIRKKMNYILKLNNEIEILEGGSLDYKITVEGKDELAALAEGIDNMRLSFQSLIDQEAKMIQENQRIVTEMSHDLRTPVTSIMLYTEILKKGNYKNDVQLKEYIDKIERKVHRMKQLTDHLFEYSLITGETEVELEKPEYYEVLFYDLLSETCSYLEQQGFQVSFQVEWIYKKIKISENYIMRITDNITSNLVKYADPAVPITISSACEGSMAGFMFENKIQKHAEAESTGIGVQSIKNMMLKMGGKCMTQQDGEMFRITLLFPVCKDE